MARFATRHRVRILMYHRFTASAQTRCLGVDIFEEQIRYLREAFVPLPLTQVVAALRAGDPLPERAAVVTVDDGYADFCQHAAPVLAKYEVPATLFVVSDFVSQRLWLWYDAIRYIVERLPSGRNEISIGGAQRTANLDDAVAREALWERIADDLLDLPMRDKWLRIQALAQLAHVDLPLAATKDFAAATWEQLRQLDSRLFTIGAHTRSHAVLAHCEPQELRTELAECREAIEQNLDRPATLFCYPNGQPSDYNETCIRAVREAGYLGAVVAHGSLVAPGADVYTLERLSPSLQMHAFRNEVNGLSHLRQRLRSQPPAAANSSVQ